MPTIEEMSALARQIAGEVVAVDAIEWPPPGWSNEDARTVLAMAVYEIRRRRGRGPNRKAMGLLRSWLRPAEREQLRRRGEFYTVGSAGGHYRIHPSSGQSWKVEKHGKNWYGVARYCWHDEDEILPKPDVALAHYLAIRTDEPGFLDAANEHPMKNEAWDGDYRRRINARRRREEGEAA